MKKITIKLVKGNAEFPDTNPHFIEKQGYEFPTIEGFEKLNLAIVKIDLFKEGEKFYFFDINSGACLGKELGYIKKQDINIEEVKTKITELILSEKYKTFYKTDDINIIIDKRLTQFKESTKDLILL